MLRNILKQLLSGCPAAWKPQLQLMVVFYGTNFVLVGFTCLITQHINMDSAGKPIEYEANVTVDFRLDRCGPTHVV